MICDSDECFMTPEEITAAYGSGECLQAVEIGGKWLTVLPQHRTCGGFLKPVETDENMAQFPAYLFDADSGQVILITYQTVWDRIKKQVRPCCYNI